MVDDLPDGPFDVVFVAYNTLFNLADRDRQAGCFAAVADRLAPGGRFVVEAFVPDDPPRDGPAVAVRSMTADRGRAVGLRSTIPPTQRAEGQFVELTEAGTRPPAAVVDPLRATRRARRHGRRRRVRSSSTAGWASATATVRRRRATATSACTRVAVTASEQSRVSMAREPMPCVDVSWVAL